MSSPTVKSNTTLVDPDKYTKQLTMMQEAADYLVNAAVILTNEIKTSKTNTKKAFYSKKFAKVKKDLTQTLAAVEILKQIKEPKDATSPKLHSN